MRKIFYFDQDMIVSQNRKSEIGVFSTLPQGIAPRYVGLGYAA